MRWPRVPTIPSRRHLNLSKSAGAAGALNRTIEILNGCKASAERLGAELRRLPELSSKDVRLYVLLIFFVELWAELRSILNDARTLGQVDKVKKVKAIMKRLDSAFGIH